MDGEAMNGVRVFAFIATLFFLSATPAYAEISFVHDARQVTLSAPGTELPITVRLKGTRTIEYPLEIELIRDGVLTHLTVPVAEYNQMEEPSYTFKIASPHAGIGYRFHLKDETGTMWKSQYYFVLHKCELPPTTNELPTVPGELRVSSLARKASVLERQLASHALSSKRLSQLREILGLKAEPSKGEAS